MNKTKKIQKEFSVHRKPKVFFEDLTKEDEKLLDEFVEFAHKEMTSEKSQKELQEILKPYFLKFEQQIRADESRKSTFKIDGLEHSFIDGFIRCNHHFCDYDGFTIETIRKDQREKDERSFSKEKASGKDPEYLAQLIHNWYLEIVRTLRKGSFNPDANKPFEALTEEQKTIDRFIAIKVLDLMEIDFGRGFSEGFAKAKSSIEEEIEKLNKEIANTYGSDKANDIVYKQIDELEAKEEALQDLLKEIKKGKK